MSFEPAQRALLWEGVILPGVQTGDPRFELFHAKPRPSLKTYIHVAWIFKWDIPRGQELPLIAVPTPVIKVGARFGEKMFQAYGPRTVGSIRKISGSGLSLGFDLVPGGFYPFSGKSSELIANGSAQMEDLLPGFPLPSDSNWSPNVANTWFRLAEDFLESIPKVENNLTQISRFFRTLWDEAEVPNLISLADQFGISKRSVQRAFLREIGMPLRDAIRITRLHKGLKTISRTDIRTLANVALESGFFDQPHMIKEFKALVKSSPAELRKFL